MISYAVISDTHHNDAVIQPLMTVFRANGLGNVIHLGDDYPDADSFVEAGFQVLRVPGTWGPEYESPYYENRFTITERGWDIFLTHTPESHANDRREDPRPEDVIRTRSAQIILCGHTHLAKLDEQNKVIIANPGHLKEGNTPHTWMQMDLDRAWVKFRIFDLDSGAVLQDRTWQRTEL